MKKTSTGIVIGLVLCLLTAAGVGGGYLLVSGTPTNGQIPVYSSSTGSTSWGNQSSGGTTVLMAESTASTTFTSNTTYSDIAGLTVNVTTGHTYIIYAAGEIASAGNGGFWLGLNGTATSSDTWVQATDVAYANNTVAAGFATSIGAALLSSQGSTGSPFIWNLQATIICNGTGTLTIGGSQNSSNSTVTTFRKGAYMTVTATN